MDMTQKTRIADLRDFDFVEHLDSDEDIVEYLNAVLDENDSSLLASALSDIALGVKLVAQCRQPQL